MYNIMGMEIIIYTAYNVTSFSFVSSIVLEIFEFGNEMSLIIDLHTIIINIYANIY